MKTVIVLQSIGSEDLEIIVISSNYLGTLGFLLTKDTPTHRGATGNYGIMDQQFPLKWISENIQSFGGDPSKVNESYIFNVLIC